MDPNTPQSTTSPAAASRRAWRWARWLGYGFGGFAVAIVLLLVVAALQPTEFKITRSASIQAPPDAVFKLVNNFHHWEEWSPWAKLDPQAKNHFEGPEEGVGSIFRWEGNDDVGVGSMTILESRPAELIKIRLDFLKPMVCTNEVLFTFTPTD